jgi:hypothetical protein
LLKRGWQRNGPPTHEKTRSASGSLLRSKISRIKCAPLERACLKLKTRLRLKFALQANAEPDEQLKKQNVRSERQHGVQKSEKQKPHANVTKLMSVLLEQRSLAWQAEMAAHLLSVGEEMFVCAGAARRGPSRTKHARTSVRTTITPAQALLG